MSTLADATTRQARLPLGVSAVRADALARAVASTAPAPWPTSVRWADLAHRDAPRAIDGALTATLGVVCDETLEPWRIRFDDDAPHLLVAGAHGSGTSTLLATLVAGLCAHHHPSQLSVVLIGAGTGSPLSACARLPHVKRIVADVGGAEAAAALEAVAASALRRRDTRGTAGDAGDAGDASWTDTTSLDTVPTKLLVVVDDFDEITGRSRSAALALDRLAGLAPSVGVHLAMATHRPAGAITPTLRAACAHAVALRTTTASDSMGLVGVPDAASPGQPAGRGIARSAGKRAVVQVALPAADPSPLVRRLDRADAVPRHLAEVLIADARQETWAASDAP
nr:FtsK/SpoIIIE domain-containing protein [Demequina sp. TTPB684]